MKTPRILVLSLLIPFIQACTSTSSSVPELMYLGQAQEIQLPHILFRGKIVIGSQTSSFTPCNSKQQFLLTLPPEQFQAVGRQVSSPYQEIYGEVIGFLTVPSQTGYNADYQARLIARQINYIGQDALRGCSQPPRNTQALGQRPHWQADISSPKIMDVTFSSSPPQPWSFKQSNASDNRVYATEQGSLTLTPANCRLTDQGLYGWMATFNTPNGRYRGCARLGNMDPSLSWVATYNATSTKQTHFSVTLELLADHSARTTYLYQGDPIPMVETGFWQALNHRQIQVVMTQHQQQYLLSQRIFTRQGDQIYAEKEQVGQQIYDIADGGLTLYRTAP